MGTFTTPSFLFRFSARCQSISPAPKGPAWLDESFRLPWVGELDGQSAFADVRVGWNKSGLCVCLGVTNKQQNLWCRENRLEDSDGIQFWVDTRDTHNVHRAGRYCHRFAATPVGTGRRQDEPFVGMLAIPRARESPRESDDRLLKVSAKVTAKGYQLAVFVPSAALTGYETPDVSKLGFAYAVRDKEHGLQTFPYGRDFPFEEDPSVWGTLELV